MTRGERTNLNRILKPYGLRICSLCGELCRFDEFYPYGDSYAPRCIRCSCVLGRVYAHERRRASLRGTSNTLTT